MEIPIPDIPSESPKATDSPASENNEQAEQIPQETPLKKTTLYNSFETPNVKNASRLDALYMSGIKKPRYEVETPSRKISRKELHSFIDRTEQAEEKRKKKQEELKRQEDQRIAEVTATTKKLSRKEIEKISNRLSMTPFKNNQPQTTVKKQSFLPQATPARNPKVFNRLYLQSTCKKRFYDEDEEMDNEPKEAYSSSISAKSLSLASKHNVQKVAEVFGDVQTCTKDEIMEFFKTLAIIDDSSSDYERSLIDKVIEESKVDDEKYNACIVKEKLIECFIMKKQTKFSRLVTKKFALARANERAVIKNEEPVEDAEEMRCAAKMQKETLERLLNSKPAEVEVEEEPAVQTKALSEASKTILLKSERTKEIADLSLDERDKLLLQKRDEVVNKLKETIAKEEESQMKQPTNLGVIPEFYDKLPEEKRRRTKKADVTEEEPSFKPKTNSYDEFKKKNLRAEPKIKPVGWEQTVERIRLGRIERNKIQAALDIRNSEVPIKKSNVRFAEWKKKVSKRGQRQVAVEAATLSEAADIDAALGI